MIFSKACKSEISDTQKILGGAGILKLSLKIPFSQVLIFLVSGNVSILKGENKQDL